MLNKPEKKHITVTVNGVKYERDVEPRLLLSDFIRNELGLTGTHVSCEQGICGACTIILNDTLIRSCLMFAVQADGCNILTIEGLDNGSDKLHPIQEAFNENHAVQCGFCTPGMILTAYDFLKENPNPSDKEIKEAISGNICRCTGYTNIIKAVKDAAQKM